MSFTSVGLLAIPAFQQGKGQHQVEGHRGPQKFATNAQPESQIAQEKSGQQVIGQHSPPGRRPRPTGHTQRQQRDAGQPGQQQGLPDGCPAQQQNHNQPGIDEQPETGEDLEQRGESQGFLLEAKVSSSRNRG